MSEQRLAADKNEATKVTLIGALLDLLLGIAKILVGFTAGSLALISDGIHSLSDLLTDGFVLFLSRYSRDRPDREHPYGHGRFETVGTVILGVVLFAVAGIICYDAILRYLRMEELRTPGLLALIVAIISILSKEWIFRYTRRIANKLNSSLLLANAWHSRTDAFSSIAVLIGLIFASFGFLWMDLVAAVVVALMIAVIAWKLVTGSMKELVDTALPKAELDAIRDFIVSRPGIVGSHQVRSRLHGGRAFLDIHVQVDSRITVSEGHYLADKLMVELKEKFSSIDDLVIHIDPELDLEESKVADLPSRQEVQTALLQCWQGELAESDIEKLRLHYLKGRIEAEVYLRNKIIDKELRDILHNKSNSISWLHKLTVYGSYSS